MSMPLTDASPGRTLIIKKMAVPELACRLRHMGLFEGSEIVRLDREVLVRPVRVRGPNGDAVLGGGMAMKIVVHLDDGRKLPLMEMAPGESGHIEGLTGGSELADTLALLQLTQGDPVSLVRQLPPMEYIAVIDGGGRIRLTEGMAAKIWGCIGAQQLQFVSARVGEPFRVIRVLGGPGALRLLERQGVGPNIHLTLEGVGQAQSIPVAVRNPIVIVSREGLRLFLTPDDGMHIFVTHKEKGADY